MAKPSTAWKEQVAADEAERFAGYARQFAEMQRARSAKYGAGRALHRKQHLGLKARFEVQGGLPAHARQGLFIQPLAFDAWVRLSNGSADKAADAKPDVRGFAFKVRGLAAPGALGGETEAQDFTLIQPSVFAFARTDEFVGLVMSATRGPLPLLKYLIGRYGLLGGLGQARRLARNFAKPFPGFAAATFHSAAPLACGKHAVRVRLKPVGTPAPINGTDWARDVADRLRKAPLVYELQLQFFVDESVTPIEDASIDWPESESPYLTVATLTLQAQDADSAAGKRLAEKIEAATFDPWTALADHRPLGDVMRARKVVYYESQKQRAAA